MQLKIPGLQRVRVDDCIVCGSGADMYCAGCGVTPYCSERCQRRDWGDRHRDVCHNLARLASGESKKRSTEPVIPPASPLRRPNNIKRDSSQDDKAKMKFCPPGEKAQTYQSLAKSKSSPARSNRNFNNKQEPRRPQNKNNNNNDDESWDNKPKKSDPVPPKPEPAQAPAPKALQPSDLLPLMKPKPKPELEKPAQEVTPAKPAKMELLPANYLVEKLPIGETFLASVEAPSSECASKQPGFVCLTMHGDFEEAYNKLCIDYTVDCEKEETKITPRAGMLVSYLRVEDGGWYRARALSPSRAALLDAAKVVLLEPHCCRIMLDTYTHLPEFSAVVHGYGFQTGANLKCTLKSKTQNGFKVSIVDAESGVDYGEGEVTRWLPEVEVPTPVPTAGPSSPIPSVPRPSVQDGSRVVLLDVTNLHRAALRTANTTTAFDSILHDVLLHGMKASPLKEPPTPGQIVIAMFTDGVHYRALVKRTKAAQNKYLIEYIEYGNEEITPLERLYPCPSNFDLNNLPALASIVQLSTREPNTLTPPATAYIDKLKDDSEELILTIPSGDKTAPSGALVNLTLAKNNESVNKKLEQMCTPDWKKLEERGGDVLETKSIMFSDLKYSDLPTNGEFTLEIVDFDTLSSGTICGYLKDEPLAAEIYGPLTEKMNKYCESDLCKEPYLPRHEELCITKYPPYPQWFRAVLIDQDQGPGGPEAKVLYVDYGNIGTVPVKDLRKMLPEFVDGYPALANHIDIENFPSSPTEAQLRLAIEMMNITEEGRGSIRVTKCKRVEPAYYTIQVPSLIAAMKAVK